MELTLSQIDILINHQASDEKEQLINSICLEIQKDPFCILKFPYDVVTLNRVLFDLIYKREQKEYYSKDIPEDKQLEIIKNHEVLFPYISNIFEKPLLLYILTSSNNDKLNEHHKNIILNLNYEDKKKIIRSKPYLISLFPNDQKLKEIGFLSNCEETIMFLPFLTEEDMLFIVNNCVFSIAYNEFDLLLEKSINKKINEYILNLMIQRNPKYYLQSKLIPQDVKHCISILKNSASLFAYVKIVNGKNYEEVMSALLEKQKIIDQMS